MKYGDDQMSFGQDVTWTQDNAAVIENIVEMKCPFKCP